jgi:ribosomal-protein-alanine N-acetyltransferase
VIPRVAQEHDAPEIAAVERAAAPVPWAEDEVRSTLRSPSTMAWVIGDPVAGHLLTSCVAEEAEILTIAVHPDRRRAGLARALLRIAEEAWRDRGVTAAWLEVRLDNVGAQRLYESRGWVAAGVRRGYYSDGTDARVMRWSPSS